MTVGGVTAVEDGKDLRVSNLAGAAVVEAVMAERKCRGPRLLCVAGFEKNFGPDIQRYFRKVTEETYELLWPAFIYNLNNNPSNENVSIRETFGVLRWLFGNRSADTKHLNTTTSF